VVWADQTRDGYWYVVTELVEGERLDCLRERAGTLPIGDAAAIARVLLQVLEAIHPDDERIRQLESAESITPEEFVELQALRDRGIVHRDIKPQNLILKPDGEVVLIDFNIASRVGSPVNTRSGTPAYQPPDCDFTRWSVGTDLFAVGVVLYELICGHHPYPDAEPRADREPIDPERVQKLSPLLADFLRKACAPIAEHRFSSAREMRTALERAISIETPAVELEPYRTWVAHPLPDVLSASQRQVIEGLIDIVTAEGPMVSSRAYELYVRVSGGRRVGQRMKSKMNRAMAAAVRARRLHQLEEPQTWQMNATVCSPESPAVVVRARGDRALEHIPRSEVAELMRRILAAQPDLDDEALKRAVLSMYGRVRMTRAAADLLDRCVTLARNWPAS
jgi:serine/threonine protein kinase